MYQNFFDKIIIFLDILNALKKYTLIIDEIPKKKPKTNSKSKYNIEQVFTISIVLDLTFSKSSYTQNLFIF